MTYLSSARPLPAPNADELTWLLFHQDDVISMRQALKHMSRKAVRHRLATGRWRELHPSVFVTHNGPTAAVQQQWAAVLAIGDHAVLGGITAAQAGGLRGHGGLRARGGLRGRGGPGDHGGSVVHLLVRVGHRPVRVPPGVIVHRSSVLPDDDLLAAGRPPRTRMARSLIDAAQWARTDDDARAVIAAAFQQRLTTPDAVNGVLDRLPRAYRRRLIAVTVADAAGGAHPLAEIDFLELCRRNALPEPSRQVVRRDASGRRRYLDAYFDAWRVHVEIDGGQHLDPRQAWADMQRQNELWIAGDRVLRFPAWALRTDPAGVVAQVRAALHAAGWPG